MRLNRLSALLALHALACAFVVASPGVGVSAPGYKKALMSNDPEELYLQGAVLVQTGELGAAEKLARNALAKHTRAPGFHLLLGDVHLGNGRFAEAFYEWQWEFLRTGPGTRTGELAVARTHDILISQRGPEMDEVRGVLDGLMLVPKDPKSGLAKLQGIERDRGDRFALRSFIAEALHQQNSEEAIAMYRELIRRDEAFVPGYVQLAALLDKRGRKQEARDLMARARMIDPDHWRLKDAGDPTPR